MVEIPANIRHCNEDSSCNMMPHGNTKIGSSCFPENQSKDGVGVESTRIHVKSFQFQPDN